MNKQEKAMGMLLSILPSLLMVKAKLKQIEKKFAKIGYYKTFRFHVDAPSALPLKEVEKFTFDMVEVKKFMLKFKESFDENELPNDLRKAFLETFLLLTKDGLYCKRGIVYVGGIGGVWKKGVTYVLTLWSKMGYGNKVTYSKQAFDTISDYFKLIDLIEKLESGLALHEVL